MCHLVHEDRVLVVEVVCRSVLFCPAFTGLTSRHNMNEWARPETQLVQLATDHVRALVMNETISLQAIDSDIAATDVVAVVEGPDLFLRQLMSINFPDNAVDTYVQAFYKKLDEGHRCTIPLTRSLPARLYMTTADVTLGPEFAGFLLFAFTGLSDLDTSEKGLAVVVLDLDPVSRPLARKILAVWVLDDQALAALQLPSAAVTTSK